MIKVKICGITNLEDALTAAEAGADALGFNFYAKSPRYVSYEKARKIVESLPPFVSKVGIFVNESRQKIEEAIEQVGLDFIQLHGDEKPEACESFRCKVIKAFRADQSIDHVRRYSSISAILLDSLHNGSYGGTGQAFNWDLAISFKEIKKPIILSGGLDPDNIVQAIQKVTPYGVDASSRLEERPGKKDSSLVREFIRKAKAVDIKSE
jgi:phosphoribosylanthranilate isomerase